jgi:hypothetical protein
MQAEAAEIVGHPSGSYLIRVLAYQGSPLLPQDRDLRKPAGRKQNDTSALQNLNLRVAEGQSPSSLLVNLNLGAAQARARLSMQYCSGEGRRV